MAFSKDRGRARERERRKRKKKGVKKKYEVAGSYLLGCIQQSSRLDRDLFDIPQRTIGYVMEDA
jgi:hypothetical protein